jgi:hypothetical protein
MVRRHQHIPVATAIERAQPNGGTLGSSSPEGFLVGPVALTGVEAISTACPRSAPGVENAPMTLAWMAIILGTLFLAFRSSRTTSHPYPSETARSSRRWASGVRRQRRVLVLQLATAAILTLAANTAYADFPRCRRSSPATATSRAAREPRRPARVLERRARASPRGAALIIAFGGKTNALIPLYAVGVFLSFTLSQTGMVRHHQKEREPQWQRGVAINASARSRPRSSADRRVTKFTRVRGSARRDPDDRRAVQERSRRTTTASRGSLRVRPTTSRGA